MKARLWIPVLVFLAGVGCIIAAAVTGEAKVELLVVFPLISGSSLLFILGVVLIVLSFILGFVIAATSTMEQAAETGQDNGGTQNPAAENHQRTRFGGVVLIGPVPIIFGSDRRLALIMIILAIVLMAIVLALALVRP